MPLADTPVAGPRPLVSVVIPTRDRPELLRRAVASVMGQDYAGRIECLVVFDRSEPEPPWLRTAELRGLETMSNGRRPGLAGSRNTGILAGRGELVAFCDDDDEWRPDKVRRQIELLLGRADAMAATCGITILYGDRSIRRQPPREIDLRRLVRSRVAAVHSSTLVFRRADLLERVGLVDEDLPGSYGEDYELLLRAAGRGPVVTVPDALVRVRWHPDSWFAGRWETVAGAITHLLDKHPELHEDRSGLARLYGRLAFAHAAAGSRKLARTWARRALASDWRERRAYAAIAVSLGVLRPGPLIRMANALGRGV